MVAVICIALALLCAPAAGNAGDLRGVRIESLRGDLRSLRGQLPGASVYDLKQLQRRLDEQRVETPDDPRQGRLELELRHERWRAERILRQDELAQGRARLAASRDQLAPPGYLRAPTDLDIRGAALPIGTGKLFLFIQSGLRATRAALERGRHGPAAGYLAEAERGFRALRTGAHADDPALVALAAEIAALRERVDAGRG